MKKTISLAAVVSALLLVLNATMQAQNVLKASAAETLTSQSVASSLSTLPEADGLIYVNPQRILNELVPKFLSEKDLAEMRQAFESVRKTAGVDPTKIDYIVIATRFRKPTADLKFVLPEFIMVASGDFSSESLIALARMASEGKLRDEKYGSKTISLMTIDPIVKEAEKTPMLKAYSELGVVPLSTNSIAIGVPAYLRAAIDAAEGRDRINPNTLTSLVRDTNALVSAAGSPWGAFAKSFGMLGTETTAREPRCVSKIGDYYVALTMDATNFMLRGSMNADNPDTAKIFANLFSDLLQHGASEVPDKTAQSLLKSISIAAESDEVVLRADVSQQLVTDLVKEQMKPKPKEETGMATKPAAKKVIKHRRGRRTD